MAWGRSAASGMRRPRGWDHALCHVPTIESNPQRASLIEVCIDRSSVRWRDKA